MQLLIKFTILLLGGYVVLNIALYSLQPGMLFYPDRVISEDPRQWGMAYNDVVVKTSDNIKLHGWFIPGANKEKVILFFHGNAGNISHRRDSISIFHRAGWSVLIFDYRGYGKSGGRPSEEGLYQDADAMWQYLVDSGFGKENIVVFGRSLGGAVAARLSVRKQPPALILESTFSSYRNIARTHMPLMSWLMYLRFRFDTQARVKRYQGRLLVIHSKDDEMIPWHLGDQIFKAANEPKTMLTIAGDHNSGFFTSGKIYSDGITQFLKKVSDK